MGPIEKFLSHTYMLLNYIMKHLQKKLFPLEYTKHKKYIATLLNVQKPPFLCHIIKDINVIFLAHDQFPLNFLYKFSFYMEKNNNERHAIRE